MQTPKHTDVNKNMTLDTQRSFSLRSSVVLLPAASWTAEVIFLQDLVTHDLTSTSASANLSPASVSRSTMFNKHEG